MVLKVSEDRPASVAPRSQQSLNATPCGPAEDSAPACDPTANQQRGAKEYDAQNHDHYHENQFRIDITPSMEKICVCTFRHISHRKDCT